MVLNIKLYTVSVVRASVSRGALDGQTYNLITDYDCQINALFTTDDEGTHMSAIGVKTSGDDRVHIFPASTAGIRAQLNGMDVAPDAELTLRHHSRSIAESGRIFINETTGVAYLRVSQFELVIDVIENSLIVVTTDVMHPSRVSSHGLIGQTWRPIIYDNALKFCEGTLDDYAIRPSALFGDAFRFNKFSDGRTHRRLDVRRRARRREGRDDCCDRDSAHAR